MTDQNGERSARRRSSMDGTHRARGPRTAAQQREAAERRSCSISSAEQDKEGREVRPSEGNAERRPVKPVAQERSVSKGKSLNGDRNGQAGEYRKSIGTERSAGKSTEGSNFGGGGSGANRRGSSGGDEKKKGGSGIGLLIGGIGVLVIACVVLVLVLNFSKSDTNAQQKESESTAETGETESAFAENAIQMPASLDVSVFTGGTEAAEAAASEASSQADSNGTAASEDASGEKASPVIELQGLTPEEVKEQVSKLYSWSMQIVNDKADVGATVKPTVDANETTEAATLGDAENPDSSPQEGLAEDAAQQEITVAAELAVPDFVAQKLDELLAQIVSDSEAYAKGAENEAKKAETFTETSTEISTETAAETASDGTSASKDAERVYTLTLDGLEEAAQKTASDAATMWYQMPKGGSIGSYDKASDQFVMEGAKSGFEVDQAALVSEILARVAAGEFDARIEVPGNSLSAEEATAASEYKIIGTYTTKTTANSVRNKNIQLAAEAINGTILKPGEEFSFNNVVGQRTEAKGYGAAAAYNEGEVVQEVGGGICQVSTTLYNAVLRAGLKTTKRQSHTFEPSYVTPGRDATVSWGGPDYRFANVASKAEYSNAGSYSIGIKAHYANREVTISIYGRPVLKDGYSFDLKSEKVKDIDVVRKAIEPGSDRKPTHGTKGSQWVTNLVVKKGGEVVSDKLDHNTYYSGHIEYYTEGGAAETTAPAAAASSAPAETTPAPTDATLPTETIPAETTTAAPQYETGVNGGPGVIINSGGQTSAPGPGEVGPGVSQTPEATAAPQAPATEAPQPAQTPAAPQPEPTAAPQTPAPEISDGPVTDAPPSL